MKHQLLLCALVLIMVSCSNNPGSSTNTTDSTSVNSQSTPDSDLGGSGTVSGNKAHHGSDTLHLSPGPDSLH